MTASSIAVDVRGALATALASVSASVYDHVPEAVIPPACVVVPGTPYIVPNLINKSALKVQINFTISAIVAYNSAPGALDSLEKLIMQILAALPNGYAIEAVDRPTITQVGASSMLVSDIGVSTYYTQTN